MCRLPLSDTINRELVKDILLQTERMDELMQPLGRLGNLQPTSPLPEPTSALLAQPSDTVVAALGEAQEENTITLLSDVDASRSDLSFEAPFAPSLVASQASQAAVHAVCFPTEVLEQVSPSVTSRLLFFHSPLEKEFSSTLPHICFDVQAVALASNLASANDVEIECNLAPDVPGVVSPAR